MKILIEGPAGIREVDASSNFTLQIGERVIGNDRKRSSDTKPALAQELANTLGTSMAVAIEMAAKVFNISKCSSCAKRSQALRRIGDIGVVEAARIIKESYGRTEES